MTILKPIVLTLLLTVSFLIGDTKAKTLEDLSHEERMGLAKKLMEERKNSFQSLPAFLEAAKQSNAIEVVEGLPRRGNPRQNSEIFKIRGYEFYKSIVRIRANDKNRIKEILSDETSFRPYRGPKLCGGFHPDFCVGIEDDEGAIQYLFSFWCTEVKAYKGEQELYAELSDEGHVALYEVLRPYLKELPRLPLSKNNERSKSNPVDADNQITRP